MEYTPFSCLMPPRKRCIPHGSTPFTRIESGGGGGSYFPYILFNKIETMFSQLAKQSHWKLSADFSIPHEHIRPVMPPCEHVFQRKTEKMAVEGKSLALLLVSYFLLRKKFSLLK